MSNSRNKGNIGKKEIHISKIFVYILLVLIALIVMYPLVYVVCAAFAPGSSIASLDIVPFKGGFTLEHFKHIFAETDYVQWVLNTLYISIATSVTTVVVASLSAYIFSRFNFVFKRGLMMSMLILQIFPSFVGMIAIYVILLRIDGLDTLWGLVLVYLAGNIPYNTWMVKSYLDTISKSLDESARIDGANNFTIFRKIIMPIAKPIIVLLAISSFTAPWMDFIFPKMVLRSSEKRTVALGLFSMVTDKRNDFTAFAAGAILVAIPFMIFFMATQKTMVTSFGGAAVKE